jgi:hypothetical protein
LTVVFPKWIDKLPPMIVGGLGGVGLFVVFTFWYWLSPLNLDVGYRPSQPVLYSHKWHAGLMGMDCRYCHQMVEKGPAATVPATETCMNCHTQVQSDSPRLATLVSTFSEGNPVPWKKVHLLPDYAYFSHSPHIDAGVGCSSCHGRIDQMEIVRQEKPLSMGWCLECHRDPASQIRPTGSVTDMSYLEDHSEADRRVAGLGFMAERNLFPPTHCSACHR